MIVPSDFTFSQNNLQDFLECRRRFYFRHIRKILWPAVESQPVLEREQHIRMGTEFHLLVQRFCNGLPGEVIAGSLTDPVLILWWNRFLEQVVPRLKGLIFPEIPLFMPFSGFHLMAKYDLILLEQDESLVIFDWKTSPKKPYPGSIEKSMQAILYPFVLKEAGAALHHNKPVDPAQVRFEFWFSAFPNEPIQIQYSAIDHQNNSERIRNIIQEISSLKEEEFAETGDTRFCKFCSYRSLCERNFSSGLWNESVNNNELDEPITIDFNQIGELEF